MNKEYLKETPTNIVVPVCIGIRKLEEQLSCKLGTYKIDNETKHLIFTRFEDNILAIVWRNIDIAIFDGNTAYRILFMPNYSQGFIYMTFYKIIQ